VSQVKTRASQATSWVTAANSGISKEVLGAFQNNSTRGSNWLIKASDANQNAAVSATYKRSFEGPQHAKA
jgi:hypothetical protein